MIKEKALFFQSKIFQISKLLMIGWISGKKGKEKYTATANKNFIFLS